LARHRQGNETEPGAKRLHARDLTVRYASVLSFGAKRFSHRFTRMNTIRRQEIYSFEEHFLLCVRPRKSVAEFGFWRRAQKVE